MKNNLVISAINFFEGGPLSVLKDCLNHLNGDESHNYNIIALVHKKDIIDCKKYKNILFICEPCGFATKGVKNINYPVLCACFLLCFWRTPNILCKHPTPFRK
jgi:hypothetical protein